jgi:hypothetical protein
MPRGQPPFSNRSRFGRTERFKGARVQWENRSRFQSFQGFRTFATFAKESIQEFTVRAVRAARDFFALRVRT